jgi:hypothetical protein
MKSISIAIFCLVVAFPLVTKQLLPHKELATLIGGSIDPPILNLTNQTEWVPNTEFGITIWIAKNSLFNNLSRTIYTYIEPNDFTEENLKKAFLGFANRYNKPLTLTIYAFSDKTILEKKLFEETPNVVFNKDFKDPNNIGFFRAVYHRRDGSEEFNYSPNPLKEEMITIQLKRKTILYGSNIDQDLFIAIEEGDSQEARNLLAKGANANSIDAHGDNVLMRALLNERIELTSSLINKTLNINHINNEGYTALMYASTEGNVKIVNRLLKKGADINAKNQDGYSALMLAVIRGKEDIVKLLISKGADINAKNLRGRTALALAEMSSGGSVRGSIVSQIKKAGGTQ